MKKKLCYILAAAAAVIAMCHPAFAETINYGTYTVIGPGPGSSTASGAVTGGQWQKLSDGSWVYNKDGAVLNGWAFVENTYATTQQKSASWFLFDQKGHMVTGWYTNEKGETFYLNPIADNTMGAMCTGWYYINGAWYYFEEKNADTLGALYRNTLTPDGNIVNEKGQKVVKGKVVTNP